MDGPDPVVGELLRPPERVSEAQAPIDEEALGGDERKAPADPRRELRDVAGELARVERRGVERVLVEVRLD